MVTHDDVAGGQYTNLQFQSTSLGLADQWSAVKKAYASANILLGDIVKVTPPSFKPRHHPSSHVSLPGSHGTPPSDTRTHPSWYDTWHRSP